jgi:hypothetical protein
MLAQHESFSRIAIDTTLADSSVSAEPAALRMDGKENEILSTKQQRGVALDGKSASRGHRRLGQRDSILRLKFGAYQARRMIGAAITHSALELNPYRCSG